MPVLMIGIPVPVVDGVMEPGGRCIRHSVRDGWRQHLRFGRDRSRALRAEEIECCEHQGDEKEQAEEGAPSSIAPVDIADRGDGCDRVRGSATTTLFVLFSAAAGARCVA